MPLSKVPAASRDWRGLYLLRAPALQGAERQSHRPLFTALCLTSMGSSKRAFEDGPSAKSALEPVLASFQQVAPGVKVMVASRLCSQAPRQPHRRPWGPLIGSSNTHTLAPHPSKGNCRERKTHRKQMEEIVPVPQAGALSPHWPF